METRSEWSFGSAGEGIPTRVCCRPPSERRTVTNVPSGQMPVLWEDDVEWMRAAR